MIPLQLEKVIQFDEISADWNLVKISLDWNGRPLLLFEEGRPPFPFGDVVNEERRRWYAATPTAHHIVYFDSDRLIRVEVPNTVGAKLVSFVQRFEDSWLLVEGRGGRARLCNDNGLHYKTFDLGDAINDVQTAADGKIWVSYFDEGVFGGGIGANGLVCFDAGGSDIFRFAEFAEQKNLPHIDDCYALNVTAESTWLSYYSEFPLIELANFQLKRSWNELGSFSAFALRGEAILALPSFRKTKLLEISLKDQTRRELEPIEGSKIRLADFKGRIYKERFANMDLETQQYYEPFQSVARGTEIFLYTEHALFRVP